MSKPRPSDAAPAAPPARRTAALVWLGLAAVVVAALWPYLGGMIPIGVDHTLTQAPWMSLRWSGGLPLFDPYTLAGVPLYSNLQAALLYPLRWPFYFLADWRAYYGVYFGAHFVIAILGAYVLGRRWSLGRPAALLVAVLFGCGGYLAGRPINPALLYSSAWLPWLLAGASGHRARDGWCTAVAMAMIFAIGSPHLFIYGLLGYAVVRLSFLGEGVARGAGGSLCLARRLVRSGLQLGLAAAVISPALLPGVLAVGGSVRTAGGGGDLLAGSVPPALLPQVLLGGTGGSIFPEYIDHSCFVGAAALLLAISGACGDWRRRPRALVAAWILVALGLVIPLGNHIGLQHVLPWLPGLRWLTGPNRALVLGALGLALAAGLGLDSLSPRRANWLAAAAGAGAVGALGRAFWRIAAIRALHPQAPGAGDWLRAWLVAPSAVAPELFPWIEAGAGLALATVVFALLRRRPCGLRWALVALALGECAHFAPRVLPPVRSGAFYDAPPAVSFLQARRDASPAPFRVMGYDPLRIHDNDVGNDWLLRFLVPQSATLFGLEQVAGFDPMIPEPYARLVESTAGRSVINDPLRNLDPAWPDPRLLDLLGVRYVIGDPLARRVTNLPLTLAPSRPAAVVPSASLPARAVTGWTFVSQTDSARPIPLGQPVAVLRIEADEGQFDFPIRSGIETAATDDRNRPERLRSPAFRALGNTYWTTPRPYASEDYAEVDGNWRGRIAFGRPLHVRRAAWVLTRPDAALNIAAQACLLAPEPADDARWRRVFGAADDFAAVYANAQARPRASLVAAGTGDGVGAALDPEAALAVADATTVGTVRWLARGSQAFTLDVASSRPALLVLRQPWAEGWRVSGVPGEPRPLAGCLTVLDVPAGHSRVAFRFHPVIFTRLCWLAWAALALAAVWAGWDLRRRRLKNAGEDAT